MKTRIVILTWNFNSNISATMMTFLPLNFLGLSHRVLREIKNAVYRLQISALVQEIFKFKN